MGRNTLLLALVIFTGSTSVLGGGDEEAKEEMEIYKIALDFVNECGSKELSLCLKVRNNLLYFLSSYRNFLRKQ